MMNGAFPLKNMKKVKINPEWEKGRKWVLEDIRIRADLQPSAEDFQNNTVEQWVWDHRIPKFIEVNEEDKDES